MSTTKSLTGYVIMLADCPILWCSKLQTQISLSTTEAEYIAISQSLREAIPIMNLVKEIKLKVLSIIKQISHVGGPNLVIVVVVDTRRLCRLRHAAVQAAHVRHAFWVQCDPSPAIDVFVL